MPDTRDEEPGRAVGKDAPSLELPSLGWRRRRRPEAAAPDTTGPDANGPDSTTPDSTTPDSTTPDPSAAEPTMVVEPAPAATEVTAPVSVLEPETEGGSEHESGPAADPASEPRPRRERRPGGFGAAVLTGLVVGLGVVGLTWASLRLCEEVQGTSSCGDTGYGLLIAILAAMIAVGALLLRLLRVPEAGSTSFLGVGLTAALALLFLVDSLMDRPMVVVIPLLTAGTFTAAHWTTRTFAGPSGP